LANGEVIHEQTPIIGETTTLTLVV